MKTLLLSFVFAGSLVAADPAPKLVPRPIPGLTLPSPEEAPLIQPLKTPSVQPSPAILTVNPDQARVLYIHRRATLPAEFTKDLPAPSAAPAASADATNLQVRQGAIKIIPKSQVANLLQPQE
ncbi:MAG TPA: hypothetical protein DCP71_15655 [Verrucomicrobiales bacterium]|nr:hypothetical protein [Verrucomicrobiales bacterium]